MAFDGNSVSHIGGMTTDSLQKKVKNYNIKAYYTPLILKTNREGYGNGFSSSIKYGTIYIQGLHPKNAGAPQNARFYLFLNFVRMLPNEDKLFHAYHSQIIYS